MEFIIKIEHEDGGGGNLIFSDKDLAIETYDKLEKLYEETNTEISKSTRKSDEIIK